jgi:membrane-associated HD superfamily phosphohydrolase
VEHRIPHKNDEKLKYDWNNLFLSCGHCNTTKGVHYVGIIDPCKIDPESVLELRLETNNLMEHVVITQLIDSPDVTMTAKLLENVYNGKQTAIKKLEATQLRKKISKELSHFQQYLLDNKNEPDLGYDKIITEKISRSSAFAAFKRQIIRDNEELQQQFSEALC